MPGATIGILRDGDMTIASYGVADTRTSEPVTPDTRFAVGSLVKSMVATVIARLVGAGRLSLDDSVAARVPELRGTGWAERATMRDLLANRSGLPLRAELEFDVSDAEGDDDVLSRFAARTVTQEQPVEMWSYTNAGWCLLGRAIETVTGRTWEDAMIANLLEPAGMAQTSFATLPGPHRAAGHQIGVHGVMPVEPWMPRALGPAGATLASTVTDMLCFAALHLEDHSLASLRDSTTEIRIRGWLDAWCLGWARFDWVGGPVWGWDGVLGGERAVLRLVPERDGAVVLLANGSTGRAMCRSLFPDVMNAWFGIGMPALRLEPSPGAARDLSRFAGVYAWPDRRSDVTATDTRLVIESEDGAVEALPLDDRTFLVDSADPDNPTVTFGAFDESGRPGVLYEMLWGLPRR